MRLNLVFTFKIPTSTNAFKKPIAVAINTPKLLDTSLELTFGVEYKSSNNLCPLAAFLPIWVNFFSTSVCSLIIASNVLMLFFDVSITPLKKNLNHWAVSYTHLTLPTN